MAQATETAATMKPKEGEEVFAVAHIYASFNDTFIVSAFCAVTSVVVLLLRERVVVAALWMGFKGC